IFTLHDAFFHGGRDALAMIGSADLAYCLYEHLRGGLSNLFGREYIFNKLADLELHLGGSEEARRFGRDLQFLLRQSLKKILVTEPPYERRSQLVELHRLVEGLASWVRRQWPSKSSLTERDSFREWMEFRREVRRAYRNTSIYYPETMRPLLRSIEETMMH